MRLVGKRELRRGRTDATGGDPRRIIEIAKKGERDPDKLCERVLSAFGMDR